MNDLVVAVPAGQVERGPAILSLLVEVTFDGNESAYDCCVSIEGSTV